MAPYGLFILSPAKETMYPYMYPYMYPEIANLSVGLEFTGTLQSPSDTKIKKGLA
ncbi:hypothetical protein SRM1_04681 [Pseudomonas fluorescens]|nr:hypothetical protein SRM1_04681 [Pseudomonas fluorescens]